MIRGTRRALLVLCLGACLVCTSGCLELEVTQTVNKDGSGKGKIVCTVNMAQVGALTKMLESMGADAAELGLADPAGRIRELFESSEMEGTKVTATKFEDDEANKTFTATMEFEFTSLDGLYGDAVLGDVAADLEQTADGAWRFAQSWMYLEMFPTAGADAPETMMMKQMLTPFMKDLKMSWTLTLPGKIVETSGTKNEAGNTVTWALAFATLFDAQKRRMTVKFKGDGLTLEPFKSGETKASSPAKAVSPQIGDVVADFEFATPQGRIFRLSDLRPTSAMVSGFLRSQAKAAGTTSPTTQTSLDAVPILRNEAGELDREAVHAFVTLMGRRFGLTATPAMSAEMQSLADIAKWILQRSRDPIVLMPWSSRCTVCKRVDPLVAQLLLGTDVRFVALGGKYGDTRADLRRFFLEDAVPWLLVDDSSHRITDAFGLTITCVFVVLDADLKLRYRGAFGSEEQTGEDVRPVGPWLADAIQAARDGEPCFVPARPNAAYG